MTLLTGGRGRGRHRCIQGITYRIAYKSYAQVGFFLAVSVAVKNGLSQRRLPPWRKLASPRPFRPPAWLGSRCGAAASLTLVVDGGPRGARLVQVSAPAEDGNTKDLYTQYKKLKKQLEFLEVQENYIKDEQKNLRKEYVRAQASVSGF